MNTENCIFGLFPLCRRAVNAHLVTPLSQPPSLMDCPASTRQQRCRYMPFLLKPPHPLQALFIVTLYCSSTRQPFITVSSCELEILSLPSAYRLTHDDGKLRWPSRLDLRCCPSPLSSLQTATCEERRKAARSRAPRCFLHHGFASPERSRYAVSSSCDKNANVLPCLP